MPYDYDVAVIGLGPSGIAAAATASALGLRGVGIEQQDAARGNAGRLATVTLLRLAQLRYRLAHMAGIAPPTIEQPMERIATHCSSDPELSSLHGIENIDLHFGRAATFVDPHTVRFGKSAVTAKRLFICTGARPATPSIPGLDGVDALTPETMPSLSAIPDSLLVIGGGTAGCEIAQTFGRLGSRVTIVHLAPRLLPDGDARAAKLLEQRFAEEGIAIYNARAVRRVDRQGAVVSLQTDHGERFRADRLCVAIGRRFDADRLGLENAGVRHGQDGIPVDRRLRTSVRHIYAPGSCNDIRSRDGTASHQGRIAVLNASMPWPIRFDVRRAVASRAVYTDPPIAQVGASAEELERDGVPYEEIQTCYADYGAAVAQDVTVGSVRAYVNKAGRIYGVCIVGHAAPEMIHEWALAIRHRLRMHKVMLLQHSFPSMSLLTERVAERWVEHRAASPGVGALVRCCRWHRSLLDRRKPPIDGR